MLPKLSPETRTSIERLLQQTCLTQITIAAKCGVSVPVVSALARENGFTPWTRKSNRKPRCPAHQARNQEIVRLAGTGRTYGEIGERYGITRQRVHQIVRFYRMR